MLEKPLKIVTPLGSIGYGYNVRRLYQAIELGATTIINDAGSTDSGPHKLALGVTTVPNESSAKDLRPMVDAVFHHKVKPLVGSAAGDGSDAHVDVYVETIVNYANEKGYRLKLVKIYATIPQQDVHKALDSGKITGCGVPVPELTHDDVDQASRIVAQMGVEPYLRAMEEYPDYDIIIGGSAYDPAPFATYAMAKGLEDPGVAFNMGKMLECGAFCSQPKSKEIFVSIYNDRFTVLPLDPGSVCSAESVAAHSLYENTHADIHPGPGGTLGLTESWYEAHPDRSCLAGGAKFHVANPHTIKLEGAKVTGYRAIWVGSFQDPVLTAQIDHFLNVPVRNQLKTLFPNDEYLLNFRIFGKDGTMGPDEPDPTISKEIFIIGEVGAKTQELADNVASMGRVSCVHLSYPGQKATSGNFAMPLTPLEIPLGPVCQFCVYHLMEIGDPAAYFPRHLIEIDGGPNPVERNPKFGLDAPGTGYHKDLISRAESKGTVDDVDTAVLEILLRDRDGVEADARYLCHN